MKKKKFQPKDLLEIPDRSNLVFITDECSTISLDKEKHKFLIELLKEHGWEEVKI